MRKNNPSNSIDSLKPNEEFLNTTKVVEKRKQKITSSDSLMLNEINVLLLLKRNTTGRFRFRFHFHNLQSSLKKVIEFRVSWTKDYEDGTRLQVLELLEVSFLGSQKQHFFK